MHDIDRTQRELVTAQAELGQELTSELFELGDGAGELFEQSLFEAEYENESPFNEVQEMELASELLEISSEEELDQFLGKLFKGATKAIGGFVRSPVGRALGGALKKVAKTALPIAGKALGGALGGPAGAMIGGKLGSMATNLFEVELEGLSQEDQEFEVAKQFVRLAGTAARKAAATPASTPPVAAARQALSTAARAYAPGLLKPGWSAGITAGVSGRSGRWFRRGRTIVLTGV